MKTMKKTATAFALAAVGALGLAGAGYAQRGDTTDGKAGGMMGMRGMPAMMRDCPMMRAMVRGPSAALEHREALGLTDAQVKQLQGIAERSAGEHRRVTERMQSMHVDVAKLADGERFDEAAVRRAFERMSELHAELGVTLVRARHDARAILTPGQRAKLAELGGTRGTQGMHGMHGMMGSMMQGDMGVMTQHCPMMGTMMGSMMRQEAR